MPAIEEQLRRFKAQYGIETSLTTQGELGDLRSDQQLVLYRVTQEALNNVVRHARETSVSVQIARADGAWRSRSQTTGGLCRWRQQRGLGLEGMAERARLVEGEFEMDSAPGRGTKLKLRVPA